MQARKTGHIEDEPASKQELHKLADRFHTVLKSPIDTTSLAGQVQKPAVQSEGNFKCTCECTL